MAFESDFILDINDLPLSHFYTYKYEIIEYFMLPNSDEWLRKLVSKARTEHDIPEITKICTKGRFYTCKRYYEMYDPHHDKEFIMDALKVLPVDIKNHALLKDIPQFSLNLYSQLFLKKYDERVFEKILLCTKWHDIYERFNSNSKYQVFCEKIKKELDRYPGCADYLGCLFLRELPFIDYFKNIENNWYYDLRVAYAESDLNRAILMQFNPDFFPFLKGIKMKREAEEKKRRRLLGESLQIDNIKLPDVPKTLRIQSKYLDYLPEASKKAVDPQNEEEDTIYHDRIRKFKDGKINILISTDVSQNDIDISTLDCFISYNCPITYTKYIGNFKTTDGYPKNMALIVTEGLLELDDQKLFEKDRMTNCIVRRLRKMSDYEFQSLIEERKKSNDIRNKNYVEVMKEYCNKNENAVYDISCSSCMTYLCSSKDVGIFENITNIIVTPDIWSKVTYVIDKHYKYTRAFMRVGLVCCKVCKKNNGVDDIDENNTLGTIIKLGQGFVIKLAPKNLFFTDTVTKEQHYKRGWNAVETNLSLGNEISEDDFLEYCQESMCRDPEMHLLFMKKMSNYISVCRNSVYHKDI
uniref:RLR CTR domain-containing protein n=1 Tax=Strongyloides papillosus TaxID=174720 RepID=A0A0N5CAJ5_STREA